MIAAADDVLYRAKREGRKLPLLSPASSREFFHPVVPSQRAFQSCTQPRGAVRQGTAAGPEGSTARLKRRRWTRRTGAPPHRKPCSCRSAA